MWQLQDLNMSKSPTSQLEVDKTWNDKHKQVQIPEGTMTWMNRNVR